MRRGGALVRPGVELVRVGPVAGAADAVAHGALGVEHHLGRRGLTAGGLAAVLAARPGENGENGEGEGITITTLRMGAPIVPWLPGDCDPRAGDHSPARTFRKLRFACSNLR